MPETFCMQDHGSAQAARGRAARAGIRQVLEEVPPIEEYLGEEIYIAHRARAGGRKPVVLGRYTQVLPNNWKLYMENVKDSYHASILHLFFTTFELNRLSQKRRHHRRSKPAAIMSAFRRSTRGREGRGIRQAEHPLRKRVQAGRPFAAAGVRGIHDDVTLQILSVFPTFVLQQIQNAIAVRQIVPRGIDRTDLNWTYLGFADDTPEQRLMRLKQANLVGPAGYISMEDGCVGGFVQRGIAGAGEEAAIVEMGGAGAESSESRVTEASVRGFWKAYRDNMGI